MSTLISFMLFTAFVYAGLISMLVYGWKRLRIPASESASDNQPHVSVSVVIAARNEENNIGLCINDLLKQEYDPGFFEIIVVDDHSSDNTVKLIQDLQQKHACLKLVKLAHDAPAESGKKAAIKAGVNHARGELILSTDADCRIKTHWLLSMASCYKEHQPQMISAPVVFIPRKNTFFQAFTELEFISLIVSGAAAIGIKKPLMSNGANLAFQRKTFLDLNVFENNTRWASGDDMFMMHGIQKKFGAGSIHFLKSLSAVVETSPPADLRSFIMQRIRWGSKTKAYPFSFNALVAIIIFLNSFMILGSTVLAFFVPALLPWLAICWLLKIISDYLLLGKACSFLGRKKLLRWFIPFQIIHVFYITFIATLASVSGYRWKERKY
jgi:glycosyltransferase involved in cell wall biosynthesis